MQPCKPHFIDNNNKLLNMTYEWSYEAVLVVTVDIWVKGELLIRAFYLILELGT